MAGPRYASGAAAAGRPAEGPFAERLCDPSSEDCRTPLLHLIRNEMVGSPRLAGSWKTIATLTR